MVSVQEMKLGCLFKKDELRISVQMMNIVQK